MKLETERHSGKCGHCATEVPIEADVCTGCGARYGFSNGLNRQQQYDAFKFKYKAGRFFFFASFLMLLCSYLIGFNEVGAVFFGVGIISFLRGGQSYLQGKEQVKAAQVQELSWWRHS